MQNEGIKRVRNARKSRKFWQRVCKEVQEFADAIMKLLFLIAISGLIGIGLGIGVTLALTWM